MAILNMVDLESKGTGSVTKPNVSEFKTDTPKDSIEGNDTTIAETKNVTVDLVDSMLSRTKTAVDEVVEADGKKTGPMEINDDSDTPDVIVEKPTDLPQSNKPKFNSDTIKDAIKEDGEPDGGIVPNISTGTTGVNGSRILPIDEKVLLNKYELTGFTIQYQVDKDIISTEVRVHYDTIVEAMESIKGSVYMMEVDGKLYETKITMGAPIICINEMQKRVYVSEKWRSS